MSRSPVLRLHDDDLIVDNFAGGGGASLGIEWALGRSPDIAVNHDPQAIAMHALNHPKTKHLVGDVWDVDPKSVCGDRRVALAWFSPDCTHHSKAKGGKPRDKRKAEKSRGLAWVVVRWAREVRPSVIMLENVEEFADWGPLLEDGRPDKTRKGLTFRRWAGQLRAAGYELEMRELRAHDFGAPTIRKRLFVIARCDGRPIVWPEPTHGPNRGTPHRVAAECIQWDIACPSIFDRKRPLVEKTLRRIARGIQRYVVDSGDPFIAPVNHGGDFRVHSIREPLRTVTCAPRGEHALIVPTLVQTGYGERPGQTPRALDIEKPLGTIVPGGKHALVAAFLAKHYGGHEGPGATLTTPFSTVTCRDHHSLVRAFLVRYGADDVADKARFSRVRVNGRAYKIVDIGMRMLAPRELYRAQGFHDDYRIDAVVNGKPLSKTAQIRMCGNSVCPPMASALVAANIARKEVAAA